MIIIDKIEELFGDNYLIKSKKVAEMVQEEFIQYNVREGFKGEEIHYFHIDEAYKVLKVKMNSHGQWWVQG